jgi:glycosyltransferase involved in cell wall biosynthesis
MRIGIVTETYPPEINGVALSVERLVHGLRGRGHDVMLLRPRQRREPARDDALEWRSAGLPIPMYPALRFGVATVGAVERRLARWRPELLHLATPGPLAWAGLAAARARGIAVASDFRTNFHTYSRHYGLGACAPLVLRALRRLHNATDATFVPTQRLADELAGAGFDRLQVLGRGVGTQR